MKPELHEHFRKLDAGLTELLRSTRASISPADAETVQHYIDHDEYGLALEKLFDGLVDAGTKLSPPDLVLLRNLVEAMGGEKERGIDLAKLAAS